MYFNVFGTAFQWTISMVLCFDSRSKFNDIRVTAIDRTPIVLGISFSLFVVVVVVFFSSVCLYVEISPKKNISFFHTSNNYALSTCASLNAKWIWYAAVVFWSNRKHEQKYCAAAAAAASAVCSQFSLLYCAYQFQICYFCCNLIVFLLLFLFFICFVQCSGYICLFIHLFGLFSRGQLNIDHRNNDITNGLALLFYM